MINYSFKIMETIKMKKVSTNLFYLCVVLLSTGCASTYVTTSPELAPVTTSPGFASVTGSPGLATAEQLPRPNQIWVYDFVPTSSASASLQAEIGREIAGGIVSGIRQMGLPADPGSPTTKMQINDIVLKGKIVSMDEGSTAERVAIGFGSGASELKVQVEGYQVTPQGLRSVGGGTGDASGSKAPGAALGAIGAIATGNPAGLIISTGMKVYGEESGSSKVEGRTEQIVEEITERLRTRFQQEGWIQ
ncbi:DUF4410 domain-containing protein [Methylomicrobium lacus]|uniref:DUF4410 domain-containing protein n=1 Tax=Methylomicrobium lacus TaxID=136992 RepID=UPI0035A8E4A5